MLRTSILFLIVHLVVSYSLGQGLILEDGTPINTSLEGGIMQVGKTNEANLILDGDDIMARINGDNSILYLNRYGGLVHVANTDNPSSLEVFGSIRSSVLANSQNAVVRANTDGFLFIEQPSTQVKSIPSSAIHPAESIAFDTWTQDEGLATYFISTPNISNGLIAPIDLPHGSQIDSLTIHYLDSDFPILIDGSIVDNKVGFVIMETGVLSGVASYKDFILIGESQNSALPISETFNMGGLSINNVSNRYSFYVSHLPFSDIRDATGPGYMDEDFKIYGVTIYYK